MAFRSGPVALGTTDTDVFEMDAGNQGAVVLGIGNISVSARTYTVKFYKQSTDETFMIAAAVAIAANTFVKFPIPLSMEEGDKIIMSSSTDGTSLVATPTITDKASIPAGQFTPRGEYDGGTTYALRDIVRVDADDATYVSKAADNVGNTPSSSPDEWMVLFRDGEAAEDLAHVWGAPQSVDFGTLSDSTSWDGTTKQAWDVSVNGEDFDIANPSDLKPDTVYLFRITYLSNHTVNFGSAFLGAGLTDIVPTGSTGATDYFTFISNSDADELHLLGAELDAGATP